MTREVEVEVMLAGPEVSLVSGLEGGGGLWAQDMTGVRWEGWKLIGWEQF